LTNEQQSPENLPDPAGEDLHSSPWISFILAHLAEAVILTDAMGRVTRMTPAAERLTGFSESQATGKPVAEVFRVIEEGSGRLLEPLAIHALHQPEADRTGVRLVSRDGSTRAIRESAASIRTDAGTTIGVMVTFQVEAASDPQASQRLTSLGHDMSNLLLPLLLRLDALEETPLTPEASEDVRAIRAAAESLQKLAAGYRLLARSEDAPRSGDTTLVGPWWNQASGAISSALPRGWTLAADLSASHHAAISSAALTQVIFSLVRSLADARKDQAGQVLIRAWDEPMFVCIRIEYLSALSAPRSAPNAGDNTAGSSTIRIPRAI
jgi:PAS domain S-box-containing protein